MVVQAQGSMVRVIRGTAPDQDIGAITVVIKIGPVIKIVKEVIITRAISRVIRVVTITRAVNSRAKVITITRVISSVSKNSRNPDIRVIRRS